MKDCIDCEDAEYCEYDICENIDHAAAIDIDIIHRCRECPLRNDCSMQHKEEC